MISKIKEYGPITLAWFGGIQFLQPLIPNDPRKYITYQILILLVSFIIAYIYKKNRYKFLSNTQKLNLKIYYDDIFKTKYNDYIRVIATDDDLTVDKTKISPKSVYSHFLSRINVLDLENVRRETNRIVTI